MAHIESKRNGAAWRNDAVAKVTGRAKYTDDLRAPGMLFAVPVYTDYVHATVRSIDCSKASACDGVVAVITAKDVPGNTRFGQIEKDYQMLVTDKIRCVGDVVALIVAKTREAAIEASRHVRVDVTELKPVLSPREAMEKDAPLVHEDRGTNIINHHKIRRGDADKAFEDCFLVLEREFTTSRVEHAYMEPEAALCIPRPDGVMEAYTSTQHPFSVRRFVASILGTSLSDVELRGVSMGGGFGGKDDTAAIVCARTALAAHIVGRPVKMTYSREWSMRESYKRHPYSIEYKMGLSQDGTFRAAKINVVADGGAYCSVTPWVTWRSTVQCCGPYCVENVHCDVFGVYTNNVFSGAMRGFGSPQMNFAVEQMMEIAASELGISSIELRKKNMVRPGATTITGQVLDNHRVSMEEVLLTALDKSDYETKLARCSHGESESEYLYGIGLAMSYRGMSIGAEGKDFTSAIINVQFDGSVLLEVGIHENGQGSETTMTLLLAEELGIDREQIRYRQYSTSNIPDGGTTVASRGTLMGGGAVTNAAKALKKQMGRLLAEELNCDGDSVLFEDGRVSSPDGSRSMTFEEAVHHLYLMQEYPYAFETFKAPAVSWDEGTGHGNAYITWVYGAQVVELEVHKESGKVNILRAYAVHDVGRALNRHGVLGQYYGGMVMGMGYALHEDFVVDEGVPAQLNFDKYRIPRAKDVPPMHCFIIEHADPVSPSGAKGIGEPTCEIMAPAVANAICNATGERVFRLPIKVEVK